MWTWFKADHTSCEAIIKATQKELESTQADLQKARSEIDYFIQSRDAAKAELADRLKTELQHTELEILGLSLKIVLAGIKGQSPVTLPDPIPYLQQRSALLAQIQGMGQGVPQGLSGLSGLGNLFNKLP